MLNSKLINKVLINPAEQGAQQLLIVSGYATPTMASWHMLQLKDKKLNSVNINLIVGMTNYDGITVDVHEGFKQLMNQSLGSGFPRFQCQYIFEGAPVHSKLYIWLKNGQLFQAFAGSANYTQAGFSTRRREYIVPCDANKAFSYYLDLEKDSIYCNHGEIEEYVLLCNKHPVLAAESSYVQMLIEQGAEHTRLSLLARGGETGKRSGINWGQRPGREPNQAYIGLPSSIAKSGFFPLGKQHFSVVTDDNKQLILRVEQENDKAITTPMNNSILGEYLRNRIGVPNGAYVWRKDLEVYGRTHIDFYKIDEEQYFMDFSV